jgi:hypothetical protein
MRNSNKEGTMKILLTLTAGALLLVAAGSLGSASGRAAQDKVFAFGVTTQNPGCTEDGPPFCYPFTYTYRVLAVEYGDGHAWGLFSRRNHDTGLVRTGQVTCMTVAGGRAAIGGIETSPSGDPFLLYLEDRGQPGDGVPDRISPYSVFPPGDPEWPNLPRDFPRTCPAADSVSGYLPQASGDVTTGG